jgi:hypothetical protein
MNMAHDRDQCEYGNEISGFHKMLGTEQLTASQEGLICMEAVG